MDGSYPDGDLTRNGSKFYGMTSTGGTYADDDDDGEYLGYGTVFLMNADGTGYTILHSFAGGADGAYPQGSLLLSGSTLYGMTSGVGPFGLGWDAGTSGTIFSINTDGTGYMILHSFTGGANDGAGPRGQPNTERHYTLRNDGVRRLKRRRYGFLDQHGWHRLQPAAFIRRHFDHGG